MSFLKKTGKAVADLIPGVGKLTFDDNVGKVFITSGTGVIGYRVALSLLEAGHKNVRVGVWMGERQTETSGADESLASKVKRALEEKGAEVIDFDWANPNTHKEAVSGVNTVFCTLPHMESWAEVFPNFLTVCKDMKVEHFIKISFLRDLEGSDKYRENVPFVRFHSTCDDLLEMAPRTSRISYTILCASHLMSTPLLHQGPLLREDHKFITASYGMGINYVSPNDVADCAVVCIMNQKAHRNKIYNLTGSGPITDDAIAKLLSQFYGTEIEHIQMGYHAYKRSLKERGLPEWLVKDSAEFERMKASGSDERPGAYTKDIEKLTGNKPETFKDYLTNKSCMRPGLTFP